MCLDDCGGPSGPTRRTVLKWSAAATTLAACGAGAPVPQPAADDPAPVATRAVTFRNGDVDVTGMLFRPERATRLPIVVVGHGDPGLPEFLQALCRRIAAHDLAVLLLDWTRRLPAPPPSESELPAWRRQVGSATLWRAAASDFAAGATWLGAQKLGDPERVGAVGLCGGGVVLAHHAIETQGLRSLILLYASARLSATFSNPDDPLPDLVDVAHQIGPPVQGHYGLHDGVAKPEDARELQRRLAAADAPHAFHFYEAGHGYMTADVPLNPEGTFGYVPDAAATTEQRVIAELRSRLP